MLFRVEEALLDLQSTLVLRAVLSLKLDQVPQVLLGTVLDGSTMLYSRVSFDVL